MTDVMPCGCRWRRDPRFGDVLDQCAEHRAETVRCVWATDRRIALEQERRAKSGLDREIDGSMRRRRR